MESTELVEDMVKLIAEDMTDQEHFERVNSFVAMVMKAKYPDSEFVLVCTGLKESTDNAVIMSSVESQNTVLNILKAATFATMEQINKYNEEARNKMN